MGVNLWAVSFPSAAWRNSLACLPFPFAPCDPFSGHFAVGASPRGAVGLGALSFHIAARAAPAVRACAECGAAVCPIPDLYSEGPMAVGPAAATTLLHALRELPLSVCTESDDASTCAEHWFRPAVAMRESASLVGGWIERLSALSQTSWVRRSSVQAKKAEGDCAAKHYYWCRFALQSHRVRAWDEPEWWLSGRCV